MGKTIMALALILSDYDNNNYNNIIYLQIKIIQLYYNYPKKESANYKIKKIAEYTIYINISFIISFLALLSSTQC